MDYLEKIRELRKAKGLTQIDMAEQVGMAQNNYGKLEKGQIDMSVKRLIQIAKILGVTPSELLGNPPTVNNENLVQENIELKRDIARLKSNVDLANTFIKMLSQSVEELEEPFETLINQHPQVEQTLDKIFTRMGYLAKDKENLKE